MANFISCALHCRLGPVVVQLGGLSSSCDERFNLFRWFMTLYKDPLTQFTASPFFSPEAQALWHAQADPGRWGGTFARISTFSGYTFSHCTYIHHGLYLSLTILTICMLITSTFMPLVLSVVLYACNGRFKISYIDSLLLCVGAMTMGGLAPVDVSSLTPWQQIILFIEMCLGSPVCVYVLVMSSTVGPD